ncbi:MAG: hypothetical protein ACRYGF_14825 [Janthinobacterium lividum]
MMKESNGYSEFDDSSLLHPTAFRECYVAARPVPYRFSSESRPAFAGGVLRGGQAVWLESALPLQGSVEAFVDRLGLIMLDSGWLRKKVA